jgi:hypothetical protein
MLFSGRPTFRTSLLRGSTLEVRFVFSSSSASPAIGDSTAQPPGDWTPAAVPSGIIGIGERVEILDGD